MEKNKNDIIAAIVTHRTELAVVERSVESLLNSADNIEIYIVDDGSGAGYVELLREELSGLATVISANENNPNERIGIAGAYNKVMMNSAPSDYFIISSPFVEISKTPFNILLNHIKNNNNIGMVVPKLSDVDGDMMLTNRRRLTLVDLLCRHFLPTYLQHFGYIRRRVEYYQMLDIGYGKPCHLDYANGSFMLFKRDILERIGGFDSSYGDFLYDADITLRTNAISRSIYVADSNATYHKADAGKKTIKDYFSYASSILTYFSTWGIK